MASEVTTNSCPIKTVVVLVQENRSFDHMLGWMKSLNPEIDGVTGKESNPLSTSDSNSPGRVYYGMSEVVMNGFKPEMVPVYKELVSEFAVCDRWFASIPTLTQPNRLYVHSATSYGATANDNKMMVEGYPQKTIFESVEEAGLSFGIYYQYPPSTLFYRNLRKLKYINNFHQFDLDFRRHCEEGKLPNYVVVEQRYFETKFLAGNDDHPSHDVSEGQKFVKHVYEALRSSPQWNEILFVVLYDEHGGFYDHVPTPDTGVPSPDGIVGPPPYNFRFDRLGIRVPAILISPWIERGTVLHEPSGPYSTSQFEHSSIPATVKKIFNLPEFLTKRDAWAGTFEVVLNRSSPRTDCPVTLPEPVKMRDSGPREENKLNDFQQVLVLLAAVLKGDHHHQQQQLVDNMTVIEAVNYVEAAFSKFLEECEKAKNRGADGSHIPCLANPHPKKDVKSFGQKLFSCLVCDH
ncbi:hypothetical protein RHMOL_Rhmol07G0052600 [Rhododendron molle]|uniref:Uncharacterized protein n=1 Tax=Rhododendron molle TaxID=49168 RepID=A0ACC0MX62_RHOML|nr:hypothetical protein RHMOL_Rhmol07G0052600 [Rhododendron molle]